MLARMTPVQIKKLPDSKVEIQAAVGADEFNLFFQRAIAEAQKNLELPGFRKGMVPEKKVIEMVGENHLMQDAAQDAMSKHWIHIVQEADIEPVGQPEISITKIAKGNPLEFTIVVSVLEKVTLPDFKAIAKEIMQKPLETTATEEEIEKAFSYVKQNQTNVPPDMDDQKLKDAIRQNFQHEKEMKAREERRVSLLEAIAKKSDIKVPEIVTQGELEKMIQEFQQNLSQMKLKWEDYLTHIKKTEEELKKSWHDQAKTRAEIGIVIREIARTEKLMPTEDVVQKQSEQILRELSSEERAKVSADAVFSYVFGKLQHQMVFQLLEQQ